MWVGQSVNDVRFGPLGLTCRARPLAQDLALHAKTFVIKKKLRAYLRKRSL
jgi:hypothetical protein